MASPDPPEEVVPRESPGPSDLRGRGVPQGSPGLQVSRVRLEIRARVETLGSPDLSDLRDLLVFLDLKAGPDHKATLVSKVRQEAQVHKVDVYVLAMSTSVRRNLFRFRHFCSVEWKMECSIEHILDKNVCRQVRRASPVATDPLVPLDSRVRSARPASQAPLETPGSRVHEVHRDSRVHQARLVNAATVVLQVRSWFQSRTQLIMKHKTLAKLNGKRCAFGRFSRFARRPGSTWTARSGWSAGSAGSSR